MSKKKYKVINPDSHLNGEIVEYIRINKCGTCNCQISDTIVVKILSSGKPWKVSERWLEEIK